jgi:hypothetical protein
MVLAWQAAVADTLLRCSMQTVTTLLLTARSTLFALELLVDVPVVDAVTVEELVVSMDALRLFWVVDSEHSVCKVVRMQHKDVQTLAIPA